MEWDSIGSGGVSGLVVSFLAALGVYNRVKKLENDKVSKDVFEERYKTVVVCLQNIEETQKEMRQDIKEILRNGRETR